MDALHPRDDRRRVRVVADIGVMLLALALATWPVIVVFLLYKLIVALL